MNIKNLVNKEALSITNCVDEPIHIPGSIQPYGFLLGVEKKSLKIVYCSENCTNYFELSLSEILSQSLSSLFVESELAAFNVYFSEEKKALAHPFIFSIKGKTYNTTAHKSKDYIVLEFEPFSNELLELPDLYIQTKRFAYHTERSDNLKMLCQDVADQTKSIIGFDRVMIYRFDEEYNGEVFAESKNQNLEPFLGLHYPHTDIPAQARECSTIQHELHFKTLKEEQQRYQDLNVKLQKANDELANMNWISTHDLKEPLRKIQIYASVILENETTDIPENVKKTIIRMQASASKMQDLINDLHSYTKIMDKEDRLVNVDLNSVLNEIKIDLIESLEEKGGNLEIGTLPAIKGVEFQIQQLFINLISNSIKFSRPSVSPIIKIYHTMTYLSPELMQNNNLNQLYHCIVISDNGIGFNEAYKEDVFKIFHRLHSNEYRGTGIGLAICKKIMQSHNGFIDVESEENKGTNFALYFPKD